MSLCPTCPVIDCQPGDPYKLYSLQSEVYPFVVNCPPGYNCNPTGGGTINLVCCDDYLVTRTLPNPLTQAVYDAIVQGMIQECSLHIGFCDGEPPPNPVVLYSNTPQSCTVYCADGTPWTFTVAAGVFMALTQDQADAAAQAQACVYANNTRTCLSNPQAICCANTVYSSRIIASGGGMGVPPASNTWSLLSGTLPPGLTLQTGSIIGSFATITGTPTTAGTYGFTVQMISPLGYTINKTFTISVIAIGPTACADATIGTAYSQQLTLTGNPLATTVSFAVTSGSLPAGLTMTTAGLISGTPTALPTTFTITATIT